ncbi:MAG: SLBB domain-containing protein [Gammaproteobacteria bacterium]|nr:SLBB domain-containing protein [Gammaproteobacteria bacterium]MBU2224855.1 SLBB domain-containing protein [Gammaproteobacteria bacterium]MBU2426210.1 SLBB domain-containing protein [Gammaproteobacteria bacterium]
MIAQLKKLPKSEQMKIAKQYGFDLNQLNEKSNSEVLDQSPEQDLPEQLEPANKLDDEKEKKEERDPSLPVRYGLSLFDSSISTFAPVGNIPVPDSYLLGADDELLIQIFGKENSEEKLSINRDGSIQVPSYAPIQIAGLSFAKAKALIIDRITKQNIGVEVAVSMGKLRTINVFLAGEAKFPGSYTVSALATLTQTLFVAGGVSDIGSLREISVKRAGKDVASFDLYRLLLKGDSTADIHLQHGDVVFIPAVKSLAEVSGEVNRPALYELKSGETVSDLVDMAGGSKAGAFPRNVVVERFNEKNVRSLLNLDLTKAIDQTVEVRNGDVLRIGQTSKRVEHLVTVAGAAVRPGQYAWTPGIRVNSILNSLWSDLHLTVDLDYALVVREKSELGDLQVIQFNLGKAITEPESTDNLELSARDLILVFHHGEESFNRPELDKLLYTKLTKQYTEKQLFAKVDPVFDEKLPQPFIADVSALASQAFAAVSEKKPVEINRPGVVADRVREPQNREHKAYLKFLMQDLLNNVFYDADALKLSVHLTRTELLYPLLQRLRQQARFNASTQIAAVYGEVKMPGEYPLPTKGTVGDLLVAAGGLNDSAYLERAEITRSVSQKDSQSGVRVQHINVNLLDALQGKSKLALASRDRLTVFAVPDWNIERTITISGQVKFPGTYTIQQGEKLSQVMARAGGLTDDGFASGAVFTREQIREQETMQLGKLMQQLRSDIAAKNLSAESDQAQTKPEDAIMMISEIEKTKPIGRLVIDLPSVIDADPEYDLLVEEGDELYVPSNQTTVSVVGEVQHASSHRFRSGMSVNDYLQLAGGFRKRADDERVYVIRADGSVFVPNQSSWFAVSNESLQAGDTIVVPLDTDYTTSLSLWSKVTTIISQSIVALAAINNTVN